MSDDRGAPADEPGRPAGTASANGSGIPHGTPAGTGDDGLATAMMHQLTDLLGRWEQQALDLAERGVDPRPLLRALAGSLRMVADQLDPPPTDVAQPGDATTLTDAESGEETDQGGSGDGAGGPGA